MPVKEAGWVSVSISNNGIDRGVVVPYEYHVRSRLTSVSPRMGTRAGGTQVTFRGSGFVGQSSSVGCIFGAIEVSPLSVDETEVVCVSPKAESTGSVQTWITGVPEAGATSDILAYDYLETTSVMTVVPCRGALSGGTYVSVTGSGFVSGSLQCRFGTSTVSGSEARYVSSTQVVCVSPAWASGSVQVELSVNDGADFTSNGQQYLYETGAEVASV